MPLPESMLRFRRSVWFRVLYVAVLALVMSSLLPLSPIAIILVPLTLLVIPYWLRERGYRKYIVNGIAALLGGMLIISVYVAADVGNRTAPPSVSGRASGVELSNGTVTPFRGPTDAAYTYSVDIRTPTAVTVSAVQVWVNMTYFDALNQGVTVRRLAPLSDADADFVDGKRYQLQAPLESSREYIYFFRFTALVNLSATSKVFAATVADLGPVVSGFGTPFLFVWAQAQVLLVPPAVVYLLLLGAHRVYKRSRAGRQRLPSPEAEPPAPEDTYTCTNCGADVAGDAARCPSCGAIFEEGPEAPPSGPPSRESRDGER